MTIETFFIDCPLILASKMGLTTYPLLHRFLFVRIPFMRLGSKSLKIKNVLRIRLKIESHLHILFMYTLSSSTCVHITPNAQLHRSRKHTEMNHLITYYYVFVLKEANYSLGRIHGEEGALWDTIQAENRLYIRNNSRIMRLRRNLSILIKIIFLVAYNKTCT